MRKERDRGVITKPKQYKKHAEEKIMQRPNNKNEMGDERNKKLVEKGFSQGKEE